jgi:hypothetical protein
VIREATFKVPYVESRGIDDGAGGRQPRYNACEGQDVAASQRRYECVLMIIPEIVRIECVRG